MKRRSFLTGMGMGAASTTLTLLGADWWAQSPLKAAHGLAAGHERARVAGKPLLVLVIPADRETTRRRGERMGAFLNHARDAQLAVLGLAEFICSPEAQVRERFPTVPSGAELVLVETDRAEPEVRQLRFEPNPPPREHFDPLKYEEYEREALEMEQHHLDALALQLRAALWGEGLPPRRLAQLAAALGGAAQRALRDDLSPDQAFAAAALAVDSGAPEHLSALALGVAARWREQPPPGARWAVSSCGVHVEGEWPRLRRLGWSCGIGHVPPLSKRFLYLFTQDPWRVG